jgi:hypothetical protein
LGGFSRVRSDDLHVVAGQCGDGFVRSVRGQLEHSLKASRRIEKQHPGGWRLDREGVRHRAWGAMYAPADRVPARTRYLRLSHGYARKLVRLHREWIADIEAELTRSERPAASTGDP